ncbi:chorismate synthase [Butyrivibrio sp. MC2013]|uniref:chorismate synthase n=1 Tax=Butyrivibrio sp. MC2013 TaxID=1280686 RepID=UPI00040CCE8D|nr:chorismate synthase [Butyrivibrio sp. MC2013]
MAGSVFGNQIKISTFGESHGPGLGVVIDGFPAGMELNEEDIQKYLDRRKPGTSSLTTPRKEDDKAEILSGVFEGKTTGCPIAILIRNTSQRSGDYSKIADIYRPGHADYTFDAKYGFRDYRGGGRSSGRETAARVAAGAVCAKLLSGMGIDITAYAAAIGPVTADLSVIDKKTILSCPSCMPDPAADKKAVEYIESCRQDTDSSGGIIECRITGAPAGIGDPVFMKLDALFAGALMSIGAVKAVEIGDGCAVSGMRGSEDNDGFRYDEEGKLYKTSNHAGGIMGGISDGSEILLRCHVKPTPSISLPQNTVSRNGSNENIVIGGRHDPVIVPRAVVVVEAMAAIVLLDSMLSNMTSKASKVIEFYSNDQ